jgi:hypothetical protein
MILRSQLHALSRASSREQIFQSSYLQQHPRFIIIQLLPNRSLPAYPKQELPIPRTFVVKESHPITFGLSFEIAETSVACGGASPDLHVRS